MQELNFLINLPILTAVKDADSRFITMSTLVTRLLGWKSVENCIGKTDHDIPSPVSEYADIFVNLDKKVIKNTEKLLTLEVQKYFLGWKMLLAERIPLLGKNGKLNGIFTTCVDVSNTPIFKEYLSLNQHNNGFRKKSFVPASYLLSEYYCPLPLTERQQDIVFFMIRGKSAKEIAKILNLSYRTIESHLDSIKSKLACHTKSQLIETVIDRGFLYYIPKNLQKNNQLLLLA